MCVLDYYIYFPLPVSTNSVVNCQLDEGEKIPLDIKSQPLREEYFICYQGAILMSCPIVITEGGAHYVGG